MCEGDGVERAYSCLLLKGQHKLRPQGTTRRRTQAIENSETGSKQACEDRDTGEGKQGISLISRTICKQLSDLATLVNFNSKEPKLLKS